MGLAGQLSISVATTLISQPGWSGHHGLDDVHYEYGEPVGEVGRQCTDLAAYLNYLRIPADLPAIDAGDFLPFEEAVPRRISRDCLDYAGPNPHLYPKNDVAFSLKPGAADGAHSIILSWLSSRFNWVALRQGPEKCPYCEFAADRFKSAFLPDEYCYSEIARAFDVPADVILPQDVRRTYPDDLDLMGRHKSRFTRITFRRGYYDHIDSEPSAFIRIPHRGTLPGVPENLKKGYVKTGKVKVSRGSMAPEDFNLALSYDPFTEVDAAHFSPGAVEFPLSDAECYRMQLRWVKERKEWVAVAYGQEGFADHSEWYRGPYFPDDYCVKRLRQAYGILPGQMGKEIIATEPALLLQEK